jgi:hypothetical protein
VTDPDKKRGLYRKYFVQRLDERDAAPDVMLHLTAVETDPRQAAAARCGCREAMCPHTPFPATRKRVARPPAKHAGCRYYVLDLDHDAFAGPALLAYADACEAEFPALAADLRRLAPAPSPRESGTADTKKEE